MHFMVKGPFSVCCSMYFDLHLSMLVLPINTIFSRVSMPFLPYCVQTLHIIRKNKYEQSLCNALVLTGYSRQQSCGFEAIAAK